MPRVRFPPLYAILDVDLARRAGWDPLDLATAFLAGGARFLQVRAKGAAGGELLDVASAVVECAHAVGGLVLVNDRADVARLAGADGVHVGQHDLSPEAVRTVVGAEAVVGLSTHTSAQIGRAAGLAISYLAIGPVFATATKQTGYEALGLEGVRQAAGTAGASGVPLVAIGGITLERAADVRGAGAASVAVISDLLSTGDPEGRVRAYIARLAQVGNV